MAGRPAARLTDPSVHGGKLVTGSPNVIFCSKPAARQGDGHVCPIPGHGPGRIVGCSRTVIINKRGAARLGDFIACATPPSPPVPGPNPPAGEYQAAASDNAVKGMQTEGADEIVHKRAAEYKVKDDDNQQKILYAEAKLKDSDKDGRRDTATVGVGLANISARKQQQDGHFGAAGQIKVLTAEATAGGTVGKYGAGGAAGAKAEGTTAAGSVFVGPKGDNGKNPYQEVGVRGTLGVAEAGAEGFIGDDGRRVGIGGGAKAGAAVLEGEVNARNSLPIPFTKGKYTLDFKRAVSGSLVSSPGGEVRAAAYWDKQESRFHFMGGLAAKFLAGLGISWDLSIGKRYESSAPAGTAGPGPAAAKDKTASGGPSGSPAPGPNAIALGCTSVIIGG